MNPKNPQAASEGSRERIEAQVRDVFADCDIMQATEMHLPVAPAIAPGGDAEVMRKVLDMLQSGLWEDAEDFLEAHVTALPAPANAGAVDDALAERERAAKDAERYRWLRREANQNTAHDIYGNGGYWRIGLHSSDNRLTLDAAIDAAIAAGGEGAGS